MSADASRPSLGTGRRGRATLGAHLDALADADMPTLPRLLQPPLSPSAYIGEEHLQRLVVDLAQLYRWECWHDNDSRKNTAGWPDWCFLRPAVRHPDGRRLPAQALFVELKTRRGKVRPEQRRWGNLLLLAGLDYRIWRPQQWPEIIETLTSQKG